MAYGISTYLANKLLDHAFRNTTYTPPATVYARMHTGDPGAAGTSNGSSVTTRYACAWNAASGGSIAMSNTPEHTLGASETITGVSFWDAATSGNFLYSAQASVSKGGVSGDIIRISSNSISFTPLAS
ncbi:phage tail fiber protein [Mycolicibacterium fortuitum]|uniref:phage tail fiber protein n=1 Tax=Mycolicibacterium fortuitum TaxID=1766 RepID=UPI00241FB406|nr:hypothetical protein [Mycolicibacterium fortuitum]MDG5773965.1 hypothetical protein [Mycolicibacterium fortuitum]MDG5779649.1 hypothetical protein [Mycolicibacterium fortuitum]